MLAAAQFATVARSAQLTLEVSAGQEGATLQLLPRTQGAATHISAVSVALDGTREPVRMQGDGSWFVPLPPGRAAHGGKLDVYVVHDGIREVLSGPLSPAAGGTAGPGALRVVHKQLAWWVLNIVVVLVGVIALSRRLS